MHAPAFRLRDVLTRASIALGVALVGVPHVMAQASRAEASKSSEDEHARGLFEQGRQAYQDARYDLALIAISERDTGMARRYLQQVIDTARDPSLKSAARKLAATLDKPATKR